MYASYSNNLITAAVTAAVTVTMYPSLVNLHQTALMVGPSDNTFLRGHYGGGHAHKVSSSSHGYPCCTVTNQYFSVMVLTDFTRIYTHRILLGLSAAMSRPARLREICYADSPSPPYPPTAYRGSAHGSSRRRTYYPVVCPCEDELECPATQPLSHPFFPRSSQHDVFRSHRKSKEYIRWHGNAKYEDVVFIKSVLTNLKHPSSRCTGWYPIVKLFPNISQGIEVAYSIRD
ncbi:uncharacterized protein BO88DRAFT_438525 [Aspergillus vadensis CBS 113365]|uniref:Uncharacterized protein n=1 Tax=Aspergillus vadensis (strain CBS 113365 / IMI 142717 / IBT 24658) TaxID=1448311 RepID=A0A319BGA3_ASPVC|nr:hypothetical protein BO88DRAFT_438525 [Aspergillus vadensis CBS 113365]PYH64903.1 hypothetical protein BO88DRAFT_438525 [Aspergillus vadensis CBS 113365]